jgi:cytochrome P450
MALHPEVQAQAQAEIDRVLGFERLPVVSDISQLPYTEAVLKELLRFNITAPLGMPHGLKQDDMYNGYLIPKGSVVIPNIWSELL